MKASQESAMKKLIATTVTALLFMTTEIVGGTYSNALAVITDAAH
jgi:Co/Zn/Cd efflux system component